MIEPDKPPTEDESVCPHPLAKAEREQDLVFLQRCFKEALCGELENWPAETFRLYFVTLRRFTDLLGLNGPPRALNLSYGERIAGMAIVELSKKISASGKGRKMDQLVTGLKH